MKEKVSIGNIGILQRAAILSLLLEICPMGLYSDNFYSWLDRQHAAEKAAMDEAASNGYKHPNGEPCRASKVENCPYYKEEKYKAEGIDDLSVNSEVSKVESIATASEREAIKGGGNPNAAKFEDVMPGDLATMAVGSTKSRYREMRNRFVEYAKKHGIRNDSYLLVDVTNEDEAKSIEPKHYDSGYMVSFQTTNGEGFNKVRKDLTLSDDEYDAIVEDLKKDLTKIQGEEAKPHIGIFGGIPEISFKVDSFDMAMDLARKYNQVAIFDNARGAEAAKAAEEKLPDEIVDALWARANRLNDKYDWKANQVVKAK